MVVVAVGCGANLRQAACALHVVGRLQAWEELQVTPEVADQLSAASSIDRLMKPYRDRGLRRPLSTTKPGSLLKGSTDQFAERESPWVH